MRRSEDGATFRVLELDRSSDHRSRACQSLRQTFHFTNPYKIVAFCCCILLIKGVVFLWTMSKNSFLVAPHMPVVVEAMFLREMTKKMALIFQFPMVLINCLPIKGNTTLI